MNRRERRVAAKHTKKNDQHPDHPVADISIAHLFPLATQHHQAGRLAEAEGLYRQILAADPAHISSLHYLGIIAFQSGRHKLAIDLVGKAIALNDKVPLFHNTIAAAFRALGRRDEAVVHFTRALSLKPDSPDVHSNLGNVFREQGKLTEATESYQRALALDPRHAVSHSNLGVMLLDQGRHQEAMARFERAVSIKPDFADAQSHLGVALREQGKLEEAVARYRLAVNIKPDHAVAHYNLGVALTEQGRLDEATAHYKRALTIKPDFVDAHSNLLLCMNYHSDVSGEDIYAESRRYNELHALLHSAPARIHENNRDPNRRIRVGYVSPDFRQHSVSYFFEPVLRAHDHATVDVFCYADVRTPDAFTERLRTLADRWQVTVGMSDDDLAERIRADRIDLLVDLAGHTAGNRLGVFARKPAPVQVSWLGYPNTTGLATIDYRLVDAVTDPPGHADAWASETLVRLEGGFLCYGGLDGAPEPAAPPSLSTGSVTFGSFNNPSKLSAVTCDAWGKLLSRLPQARLLLKGKPFADAAIRALFLARLSDRGVAPERVELVSFMPNTAAHLATYHRVDIALDPFPYNGTTTTCDAMWMGVPVVTLRGDRHAGRVGASLLTQVGLTDFIADSVDEYVEVAIALAGNSRRLDDLRRSLRGRLLASPLCDGPAFARKIEAAFRQMWQQWCLPAFEKDKERPGILR